MIPKVNVRMLGIAFAAIVGFASVSGAIIMMQLDGAPSFWQRLASPTDDQTRSVAVARTAASDRSALVTSEASRMVAALTGAAPTSPGNQGGSSEDKLAFDIARISPGEPSVLAGRAGAGQAVEVLADGMVVGSARADDNGNWVVVIDRWLARPDAKLELRPGVSNFASSEPRAAREPLPTRLASTQADATGAGAGDRGGVAAANAEMMQRLDALITQARQARPGSDAAIDQLIEAAGGPSKNGASGGAPKSDGGQIQLASVSQKPGATEPVVVPVPIQFEFQAAAFTPFGRKAAQKLLEYLKVSGQTAVSLSGHADDRGSEAYNMDLSRRRLETVEVFLRSGGYDGELKLLPMGKSVPFQGINRSSLSVDERYQIDRRVELRALQ